MLNTWNYRYIEYWRSQSAIINHRKLERITINAHRIKKWWNKNNKIIERWININFRRPKCKDSQINIWDNKQTQQNIRIKRIFINTKAFFNFSNNFWSYSTQCITYKCILSHPNSWKVDLTISSIELKK